jgi:hypothetical protein
MAIKPGTVADFSNSMAAAMENALATEYQALKGEPLPDMGEEDRRMLLVAIAQGVTRHLLDNLTSIEMTVDVFQVTGEADAPLMLSDNPSQIPVSGGGNIAVGSADVRQINTAGNLIKSRGTPVVTGFDTDGTVY